jgi:hypothetical protein
MCGSGSLSLLSTFELFHFTFFCYNASNTFRVHSLSVFLQKTSLHVDSTILQLKQEPKAAKSKVLLDGKDG